MFNNKKELNFQGKDITKDIQKIIDKMEFLGSENDYTLHVKQETFNKLQYILDSLFTY